MHYLKHDYDKLHDKTIVMTFLMKICTLCKGQNIYVQDVLVFHYKMMDLILMIWLFVAIVCLKYTSATFLFYQNNSFFSPTNKSSTTSPR